MSAHENGNGNGNGGAHGNGSGRGIAFVAAEPRAADGGMSLREISALLHRNRVLIGATFVAALAIALLASLVQRPVYESTASIRIDERQSNLPVLDVLQQLSSGNQLDTEMEVLRSRSLAESVADSLALRLQVLAPRRRPRHELFAEVRVSADAPAATYRLRREPGARVAVFDEATGARFGAFAAAEPILLPGAALRLTSGAAALDGLEVEVKPRFETIEELRENLRVTRPNRDAKIAVVRHRSHDLGQVHAVPNALTAQFIARRLDIQRTGARSTVRLLHEQIDTIASQLSSAENALRSFREGGQVVSLEAEASAQVGRLVELQAQRNELEAEREALAALLAEIERSVVPGDTGSSPYRRMIAFPTLLRNEAASELLRALAAVEDQRAALLIRRTSRDPDVEVLSARVRELEDQLRGIATTYLSGLEKQVASLDALLERFGRQLERIPAREVQFARLQRQTKVLEEIFTLLQTRLKEAEVAQAIEDPSVRVVDPAIAPVEPVEPRMRLNLLLGASVGILIGILVAFLREQMDRSVHTREDVQSLTGLSVLGFIPSIRAAHGPLRGKRSNGAAPAPFAGNLPGPVAEAYRSLRTSLAFVRPHRTVRTLVFTSPMPGEGKSTTSRNLAWTLAQQGMRVLLVDADMRRGTVHAALGLPQAPGLSNLLVGMAELGAVRNVARVGDTQFDVITTGTLPPNPAELLGSPRLPAVLAGMAGEYDMVIFDAPPLNLVTDAAVLGSHVDGVVVVARAGITEREPLRYAIDQLRLVHASLLGAVLNDVDVGRDNRYYGAYGAYSAYYGAPTPAGR